MIIIIAISILICAIAIAVGVHVQIKENHKSEKIEENVDYAELEESFNEIFTNTINKEVTAKQDINYEEIVYCAYNIKKEGICNIDVQIPVFKIDNETTRNVNKEIYETFVKTIIKIEQNANVKTVFNTNYVVYVNNNVLSLVIKCTYKDGSNPQREIIKTYNYDLENNKLLNIEDILNYKSLDNKEVQNKILEKIRKEKEEEIAYPEYSYSSFIRNENDEIYKIENTPNFFLGKNNYLYLVYAYGNNNYTSELDLVIF